MFCKKSNHKCTIMHQIVCSFSTAVQFANGIYSYMHGRIYICETFDPWEQLLN